MEFFARAALIAAATVSVEDGMLGGAEFGVLSGAAFAQTSTLPISPLLTAEALIGGEHAPVVQSAITRNATARNNAKLSGAGYDIRSFGLVAGDSPENSVLNSVALTKLFADPSGPLVVIPRGMTFRLACGAQFSATAGVSFIGSGDGSGTLKFDPGCAFTRSDVFVWDGVSHVSLKNFTLDLNTPSVSAATVSILGCKAYRADVNSCMNLPPTLDRVGRKIPASFELAPDVGPGWPENSCFIRRPAGRDCRAANEALSAFYCRSSYADARRYSLYAKPRIFDALRRG